MTDLSVGGLELLGCGVVLPVGEEEEDGDGVSVLDVVVPVLVEVVGLPAARDAVEKMGTVVKMAVPLQHKESVPQHMVLPKPEHCTRYR